MDPLRFICHITTTVKNANIYYFVDMRCVALINGIIITHPIYATLVRHIIGYHNANLIWAPRLRKHINIQEYVLYKGEQPDYCSTDF